MVNCIDSMLPDATPGFAAFVKQLVPLLLELYQLGQTFRREPPTPERTCDFETGLDRGLRGLGRQVLEREYNDIEPAAFADCPHRMRFDGEDYKRRHKSPNLIGTLFGQIRLDRYLYEPLDGGKCIFPLERNLGIEAGLATPALAERIGLYVAERPQRQVLDELRRDHDLNWSAASLRKVSASLSAGLGSFREAAQVEKIRALLAKAEQSTGPYQPALAVGRDGVMVPMRDGSYREASTATVSVSNRCGKRLGTVYLGLMPEAEQVTLSDELTSLVTAVLQTRSDGPLRLVYITDCGYHPTEYFNRVLQKMEDPKQPGRVLEWQWVVDFWHACQYLTKLREAIFGNATAGWKWFRKMRHWLKHRKQGVTHVLRSASQHWNRATERDAARWKSFRKGYGYLRKHARRMAYSRYRRRGLPIGSGVTEAACKTVFTQRLKQSGMRWETVGGQVVVTLRVVKVSGIWDEACRLYQRSKRLPEAVESGSYQGRRREELKMAA